MSFYEPRSIKRQRRTQAELEGLDRALAKIVADIEPATVRQVVLPGGGAGLGPQRRSEGL